MWSLMDNDCCQYIRNNGSEYEMIQCVWLDTTSEDRAKGLHEYVIINLTIDLDDYDEDAKEMYISSYGYTMQSLREEYGDAMDSIIAECILEEESLRDSCIIDVANSFAEAKAKIEQFITVQN
jgi:hypothetical protein